MHIVQICSELAPIAKVGGLGDVIYGLSKELVRSGHHVEIILPKYDCIDFSPCKNLKVHYRELWSFDGPYRYNNSIWSAELENLSVLLIEAHHPAYYFSRGSIYGSHDDIDRFLYFSRTALEFLFKSNRTPDVIHVHDWPTAIIPVLHEDMYQSLGYHVDSLVLTIHNLEHQGRCSTHNLSRIGLRGENYLTPDKLQDPESPHLINLLKGGIQYANQITTVSPTYEKEIKTPQGGHGLDLELIKQGKKIKGILNGIDEDFWNPEKDSYITNSYNTNPPYSEEKLKHILQAKKENKKQLRRKLNLPEEDRPLVACISRLVSQKSPILIAHALEYTIKQGGQFILLGSTHSPDMQELFQSLQNAMSSNPHAVILLAYQEPLSHLIFAGSDMIVIPSLFEPCGLTQMIALRYGTIPIVRKTGGLADTIFDIDTSTKPADQKNGFVFEDPDKESMEKALNRAFDLWENSPDKWTKLIEHGIKQDFSWKRAAYSYQMLYEKRALKRKVQELKSTKTTSKA